VAAEPFLSAVREGGVARLGGGGDCFGVGGYFAFAGPHADILLEVLPPVIHIREEADKAALRWCLEQLMRELREPRPGGSLIAEHLTHMLLVLALRLHMAQGPGGGVGWLFALADKQISKAIHAMHADPARRWTLETLARIAGLSRSTFALKFKGAVGVSAMDYLTRWRMLRAADRLANSSDPISVIAPSLGYGSESAFSTAFKRVMNCSPRRYEASLAA
jgi:AraC-like DNA-binding protein